MKLKIATRQSPLALQQTHIFAETLRARYPSIQLETVPISTQGDRVQNQTLQNIGGKALFLKELEQALLANEVDLAVHSLKDVPYALSHEFQITAVMKRQDPSDVLIANDGHTLESLPFRSTIGTSSMRRQSQILYHRPDLKVAPIRGNIGTRINKLRRNQDYDALVVAAAGVERMGYQQSINAYLNHEVLLPGIGQGVIAIETKRDDSIVNDYVSTINHSLTYQCICAERTFNRLLQGDCSSAIGAYAYWHKPNTMCLHGMVGQHDGRRLCYSRQTGHDPERLGKSVYHDIIKQGAARLL